MTRRIASGSLALMVFAMLAFAAVCYMPRVQGAEGATGGPLHTIEVREDKFLNYDFLSTSASHTNVDWAIDFIYWGNASINKVKSKLHWAMPWWGGPMWAKVNNGQGWVWDQDRGIKNHLCPVLGQTAVHTRLYAPPSTDTLWNRSWGYYIIASSHYDHNECSWGSWFGYSEDAEHWIADRARETWGSANVHEDSLNISNAIYGYDRYGHPAPYAEGNHIWWNNGFATTVHVP